MHLLLVNAPCHRYVIVMEAMLAPAANVYGVLASGVVIRAAVTNFLFP